MPEATTYPALIPIEHGRHYDLIQSAIPPYMVEAAPERRAALTAIRPQIPDWYARASTAQKDTLKTLNQTCGQALNKLDSYLGKIPELNAFAQPLLEQALESAGYRLPVNEVFVRLYAPTVDAFGVGSGGFSVKSMSLLQAALHNFEQPETEAGYFGEDSGFITRPDEFGRFKPYQTSLTLEVFTSLCRTLDIGRLYQQELGTWLDPESVLSREVLRHRYISHQQALLKVDAQTALLKGDIDIATYALMMRVVGGERQIKLGEQQLWYRYPCVMGLLLKGCVVFELSVEGHYAGAMVVWIPGDPEHPLKRYASFSDFRDEMLRKLTTRSTSLRQAGLTPYQLFLSRFIEQKDRPYYYRRLTMLVTDAPEHPWWLGWALSLRPVLLLPQPEYHTRRVQADDPDINLEICTMSEERVWFDVEIWGKLFDDMRGTLFNNARNMALSTADADVSNRSARLSHYLNIGLFAVNVLAMVVPPLGDVMLTVMAGQLLYETIEGCLEWSDGDREAAWGHIGDVLENMAMLAAGAAVVRGVSPVIERLKRVTLPGGEQRLWSPDLEGYEHPITLAPQSQPNEIGLHTHNNREVLVHEGKHYVLRQDPASGQYRALHPARVEAYEPEFRHNGHGVWVHEGEQPKLWPRRTLMRRLGASVVGMSDSELEQVLQVSGVHEDDLRRMYVENEPTPALLADSIWQFKAYAKARTVVAEVRAGRLSSELCGYSAAFAPELAGWPASKAIEVFDLPAPAVPGARFGNEHASGNDIIHINRAQLMNGELPGRVVDALTQQQLEDLLGERVPFQRDERLELFKERLSALMEKNTQRLFDSLAEGSVPARDPLRTSIEWLKRVFPKLPASIARRLVSDASASELAQLNSGKGPERLMQSARTLQREAQLSSAYRGLYMDSLVTADTETLALNTLETLPGWKDDLRIEVRNDHFNGELRASFGPLEAGNRKVLVRIGDGQYMAQDEQGQALHGADDLYSSLQHALPDGYRQSVKLPHVGQGSALQLNIQQHPLSRERLRPLLNIRAESRPFFLPPERLPDGRLGYPLSGRRTTGTYGPQEMLRARYERLYPYAGADEISDALSSLGIHAPARIKALEDDFTQLGMTLNRWISSPVDGVPLRGGPTDTQIPVLRARHYISDRLKQVWRRAGPMNLDHAGRYIGQTLQIEGEGMGPVLESLPPLSADFSHVTRVELSQTGATDAIDDFLSNFPKLQSLDLSANRLTRFPTAITRMPKLEVLDLMVNNITLTPESAEQLKGMTQLVMLGLDDSPLGVLPDLSRMPRLRAISLNNCGLDAWPAGLLAHPRPRDFLLLLEDNPLTRIPDVAPGSDKARLLGRTSISAQRVSDEVNEKINLYRESVGIDPARQRARGLASDSGHWVEGLPAEEVVSRQALWNRVEFSAGSEPFFAVISDQAQHMNYRPDAVTFNADMKAKVWRMLTAMDESPDLRDKLFEMAQAPFTCIDAGAQLFNAMGVEVMWYEAYQAPKAWLVKLEVLDLAKGKARLDQLGRIARARVQELEAQGRKHPEYKYNSGDTPRRVDHYDANGVLLPDIDEVEIYLAYTTHLARRLDLPWQSSSNMFVEPEVTPAMLESAYEQVLALEQGEGLRNQLLDQPRWIEFLEGTHRPDFDRLKAKLEALIDLQAAQQAWVEDVALSGAQKAGLRQQIEQAGAVLGKPLSALPLGRVMTDAEYAAGVRQIDDEHRQLLKALTDAALGVDVPALRETPRQG